MSTSIYVERMLLVIIMRRYLEWSRQFYLRDGIRRTSAMLAVLLFAIPALTQYSLVSLPPTQKANGLHTAVSPGATINSTLWVDGTKYSSIAAALAVCPSNGCIIFDTLSEIFDSNPFSGLPANQNIEIHQCATWTTNVSLLITTNGIVIRGCGRVSNAGNSVILAGASFPTSTPLVQIGSGSSTQGTRIEDMTLNANCVTGSIGLEVNGSAESSGIRNSVVESFSSKGIYLTGLNTTNFEIEHNVIAPCGGQATIGAHLSSIAGNTNALRRNTFIPNSGTTKFTAAIQLDSSGADLVDNHVECATAGILINFGSNATITDYVGGGTCATTDEIKIASNGTVVVTGSSGAGKNIINNTITGTVLTSATHGVVGLYVSGSATQKECYFTQAVGLTCTGGVNGTQLFVGESGSCTMASGACPTQSLTKTYSTAPRCFGSWTGSGTLTGILKFPSSTSTVTPTSSVGTDTAVVNWECHAANTSF